MSSFLYAIIRLLSHIRVLLLIKNLFQYKLQKYVNFRLTKCNKFIAISQLRKYLTETMRNQFIMYRCFTILLLQTLALGTILITYSQIIWFTGRFFIQLAAQLSPDYSLIFSEATSTLLLVHHALLRSPHAVILDIQRSRLCSFLS